MKKTLQTIDRVFVAGTPLIPAFELLAWLAAQRIGDQPRLVRLPIVLARGNVGHSLRAVRIGAASDALEIDVGDAALGVGLADRARSSNGPCAMLCEGYWNGERFDVIAAGSPLTADELAAITHAEVEGESHN